MDSSSEIGAAGAFDLFQSIDFGAPGSFANFSSIRDTDVWGVMWRVNRDFGW